MAENINEQKIKVVAPDDPETGIDTTKSIIDNIVAAAEVSGIDISALDALTTSAQTREQTYEVLDSMTLDSTIGSVVNQYASDIIQTNDKGQSIWIEASDSNVLDYTTWLLDSLNVEKHLFQWAYCLVAYGDTYIRLYRKSDVEDDLLFKDNKHNRRLNESKDKKEPLAEAVKVRIYKDSDHYIPYVEMVPNPGEMFDLQKFGKTHGFIKAPIRSIQQQRADDLNLFTYAGKYKVKQSDVEIFDGTTFVHAALECTSQRQPETIDIFLDSYKKDKEDEYKMQNGFSEEDEGYDLADDSLTTSYSIKRGQSILYSAYKIWREMTLLEMSAMLNRLTQSSVIRVINIDTGDMPKEQVQPYMQRLKEKIEQKIAVATNNSMSEYTNPAPIVNTIYVPTHEGKGGITVQNIGGDFDPKQLTDIEYFRDKLFGALGVPKQFFGFTDDGAGFNGGSSLTIISSQYGKNIKKYQGIMCQLVTDIINLFLLDRGLNNYVNKFQVRMQPPVTQEELDRRTNTDNRIRYVGDLMQQLADVEDKVTKLKIQKGLLASVVSDSDMIAELDKYIKTLEEEAKGDKSESKDESESDEATPSMDADMLSGGDEGGDETLPSPDELPMEGVEDEDKDILVEDGADENGSYIPSPADLNLNMLDK